MPADKLYSARRPSLKDAVVSFGGFCSGVDTVIGTKGVYLSGGEQQRIAIARVMLKNAPIIILDEATAFADPDNESRVQAAFSKLSEGKTVIMIAHRLSTVTNVDQIFVIQDGRVAECGNSRELLAKDGIFSRMWKNYQTSVLSRRPTTKSWCLRLLRMVPFTRKKL